MSPSPLPTPSTLLTVLTFVGVLCHVTLGQPGQPCPTNVTSPVLDDKVAGSEVVVQGRVRRKVKVSPTSRAEVEVQCVLKGGQVPSMVNVSWTHRSDGQCAELGEDLRENRVYLLYLNRPGPESEGGHHFYPLTFNPDPAERKYLEELKYACGLAVHLPEGVTESDVCKPENFVADYPLDHCDDSGSSSSNGPAIPALFVACWLLRLIL